MKSKSLSTTLIFVFIFLAVAAYFGVQGYYYLVNPQTTTLAYRYTSEDSVTVTGYFVRDEQVVECSETMLELERTEGERVAKNGALATVYRSETALEQHRQLTTLRTKLEQLQYARSAAKDTETAIKLDGDIRSELLSLRASLADGSFASAEETGAKLKTTVLKREYAYRGTEDLSAQIDALKSEIKALSSQLSGGTSTVRSPVAGTYSAVTDGYESVLTPANLETMTVADFNALVPDGATSTVGKVISGTRWYFVTTVDEEIANRLSEGQALSLRALSGIDFDLEVFVQRIGKIENGRAVIVTYSDRYLAYVTLLREQNAELILTHYDGLRIPKNALRVGENGQTGVYCRVGLIAYFKPVRVLWQGADFCLVVPDNVEGVTEGQVQLYTLRANDEVIISANELYNGKVVG